MYLQLNEISNFVPALIIRFSSYVRHYKVMQVLTGKKLKELVQTCTGFSYHSTITACSCGGITTDPDIGGPPPELWLPTSGPIQATSNYKMLRQQDITGPSKHFYFFQFFIMSNDVSLPSLDKFIKSIPIDIFRPDWLKFFDVGYIVNLFYLQNFTY